MKKIAVLFSIFILYLNAYGQNDTVYCTTYGGIQNEVCNQIKPTGDGGYIMIGTSNSFGCGNTDFYVVKIDSAGNHKWSKTYGGDGNEEGFSVATTSDHGFAFVGLTNSFGNGGYDVYLVKTDSMGNFQWQRTYGGSDWDFGYSIQQLPDKGYIICGQTYSYGAGNGDVYIIRTDSTGDTLWTRTEGGTGYDVGNAVCVKNDSLYAIVGNTTSFGLGDTNVYFILMNDKGIVIKDTTYGSTHSNSGNSINNTLDHGFVIYGSTDSIEPGKQEEMMIQIDSMGNMEWMQDYSEPGVGIGKDALQNPDGTYTSVGTNNSYGIGGYAMHIQHLQPGGWWIDGAFHGGTADQQGNSVALAKNGNIMIAGATDSHGFTEGLYDIMLVRWRNDTVVNVYPFTTRNFYDTSYCTLGIANQTVVQPDVKVFPNPLSSSATLLVQGVAGEHYFYSIYNEFGQNVMLKIPIQSASHGQSAAHIEKNNLAAGIYLCEILNQAGVTVATCKIIIE